MAMTSAARFLGAQTGQRSAAPCSQAKICAVPVGPRRCAGLVGWSRKRPQLKAIEMTSELFAQIGVPAVAPSFVALARNLGFDLEADLEPLEGEATTYLEKPERGFALAVTDSSTLGSGGGLELPLGLNPLVFSNVFLYLTPVDEYLPYEGELPLGLSLPVSREELLRQLGSPSWERLDEAGKPMAQRWLLDAGRQLHATYLSDGQTASVLSWGLAR